MLKEKTGEEYRYKVNKDAWADTATDPRIVLAPCLDACTIHREYIQKINL